MKIKKVFIFLCIINILAVSAFAETGASNLPINRQFYIPLADPFNDLEANARSYLTLTELSGRLTDHFNGKYSLDNSFSGRLAQTLFNGYSIYLWGYLSHEKAHAMFQSKYGGYSWKLDFNDWSLGVPRYRSEMSYNPTSQQLIRLVAAGLNQESYEAMLIDQMTPRRLSFDRSISFLFRQFSTAAYDIYSSRTIDVDRQGDLGIYSAELKRLGINLSPQSISWQSAISGLLSMKSWDSFFAIYNYLGNGRRTTEATVFKFKGNEFTPPLVQYILTDRGGFINLTSTWLREKKSVDFSFGSDLGNLTGDVNVMRLGLKANNLHSLGPIGISPFGYVELERSSFKYSGGLVGIEMLWKINKNFGIYARVAYSDNDLLEKTRGNESGFIFNSAVTFNF
jgi:hypothetical protein